MTLQTLIVMMLVSMCSGYAVWTLMPSIARRTVVKWLLRFKLPRRLAVPLAKVAAAPAASCGCSGCDRAAPAVAAQAVHPVQIHRRIKS